MLKTSLSLAISFAICVVGCVGKRTEDSASSHQERMSNKILLVLGSYTDFHAAHKQALAISKTSNRPFSMRGMIYDKKRGLILADDSQDDIYAGTYIHRRYNTVNLNERGSDVEYISIERSEGYPGFAPGFYMIVGGIYDDPEEANAALSKFKPIVATAYTKNTKIYMGCIH